MVQKIASFMQILKSLLLSASIVLIIPLPRFSQKLFLKQNVLKIKIRFV